MYYSKEQLELMADDINNKFFPNRLTNAIALDPYDLLDNLGCLYDWKYISPDKSVLGMTVFENSLWPIWENGNFKSGDNCKLALFKKDTIVINQSVLDGQKNRGEENFVVAHEASHWIKDKEYFMGNPDNVFQVCSKNSFNQTNWTAEMKELDIIECQTNYMAAAILMPRDILKAEFFRLLRFKNIPQNPLQLQRFMFGTIQKLSKIFNVNFNPVKYRLMDIGVLER